MAIYMPLAVTLTTDEIYNAFIGDYGEQKTFFHLLRNNSAFSGF